MNYAFKNFTFALIGLCCSLVACCGFLYFECYIAFGVFALIVVVLFRHVLALYRGAQHKIDFLFNALESDDYSFKFNEESKSVAEVTLNATLNRVKELLTNAKMRTIEQEKYYEYIFDRLNTGVVVLNERGNVLQSNSAVREFLGLDILAHINHISKVSEVLSEAILRSVDGENSEVAISSESGEKSFSLVTSVTMIGDSAIKIVAISSLDSALDRKEVETWSKLTRVLTHEIMNSLSPITSLSETLLKMNDDERMQQGLETIVQTNKSLISFVENYRSFTTVQKPVKHPFEIKPLLENILRLLCPAGVKYSLSIEPSDTMLFADENQVLQVLVNLVKNAVQAIENNSEKLLDVKVTIKEDEDVAIEVSNNGPQILPEVVENLFTPFFTTRKGGRGIGLSVSKRIMQLHSGSLTLSVNQPYKVAFLLIFK
ncbi:MAG: ATP-binding protein [Rikenellaceae bacterium]